ncbi:DUF6517 family protein [Halorarum salinum]|uniref:Uncharacterized protein n=1 Tax=Halorarum salinum TaxID=2743089 RepID=A0A7D5LBF5_9EURY|nr:DUF6517 family protein [Halobaculum salinum]QLG62590.1 hypothetical protein HUG12_12990 [Halobaculum salinum]
MRRRVLLGGTALTLAAGTAGCLGFLTGEEPLSFEAEPAAAADGTASETGYETDGPRAETVTREFTAAGQTREVEVTNRITTYEKTVEVGTLGEAKLGVFAAIASPKVEIAGRTLNPIEDHSNDDLVELLASQYEGIEDPSAVDERTVETLGSETTFTKYEAVATFDGQEVDVYVHVGRVESGDDFVVAMGVYPRAMEDQEEPNVVSLAGSLEHPA